MRMSWTAWNPFAFAPLVFAKVLIPNESGIAQSQNLNRTALLLFS
jgi:hypothetical protein